jgi:hypothetical protein
MGSYADIRIVAIVLLLSASYGVFNYLFWQDPRGSDLPPQFTRQGQFQAGLNQSLPNSSGYSTTPSFSFLDSVRNMIAFNIQYPQLAFLNIIWFGTFGALITFVILRFAREG